jgi:hypothetical protein
MRHITSTLCLALASFLLVGCDALGIESAPAIAAKKDAEAHAIGSACRHAIRSIETCFQSNPKSVKAAMFTGWKEMDAYMRENEILGMPSAAPSMPEANPGGAHGSGAEAEGEANPNAHSTGAHKS